MADHKSGSSLNYDDSPASLRWTIVTGAFLSLFAVGIIITSFGIFLKPISNELGWERGAISLAASIAVIAAGITSIFAGKLSDRFSPKLITTICGVIGGFGCLFMSQIHQLWQLYLAYGILAGISMANAIPALSLVARCFTRQRGLLTGLTLSGGGVGSIIAAPIIAKLISVYDWRISYFIVGIAVLILVTIALFCLRDPKEKNQGSTHPASQVRDSHGKTLSSFSYMRFGVFWILTAILLCVTFNQQIVVIHLVPHITDLGISAVIAATVLSVITGVMGAGSLFAGRFVDIIGSRLSLVICFVIFSFSMLILLVAAQVWIFYVFAILFGIGWGVATTLRFTVVAEIFGVKAQGLITGIMMFICNIGGAVSPIIAGYVFDVSGSYRISFILTTGVCIIGLVLSLILKFKANRYSSLTET